MSNAIPALVAFSTLRLWILLSSLRRNMAFFMALSRLSIGTEAPMGKLWCQSGDGRGAMVQSTLLLFPFCADCHGGGNQAISLHLLPFQSG